MKICVIDGTGHIGSYLVPRLACQGHAVSVVARKPQPRYTNPRLGWQGVNWIIATARRRKRATPGPGAWMRFKPMSSWT